MTGSVLTLTVALVVVFWAIGARSRLLGLRTLVRNAFARIDANLQLRYDLIPTLVEAAKTALKHEREMLEAVIDQRNQAMSANARVAGDATNLAAVQALVHCEDALVAKLGAMLSTVQACPELKSNQSVVLLTEELESTENRIAFARQAYNEAVRQHNAGLRQFPGSVIAALSGLRLAEQWQAADIPLERRQDRSSP